MAGTACAALGGEFVNNRLAFGCLTRRHRPRRLCPLATKRSDRAQANGEHWQPAPGAQGWRCPRGGGSSARGAEREEAEDDPGGGRCSAGRRRGARKLGLPNGAWRRADGQTGGSGAQGRALFPLPPQWRSAEVVRSVQDAALGREGADVSLGLVALGGKESRG